MNKTINKLRNIPIGTTIKLATKEELIKLSKLLDSNGYKWNTGEKLVDIDYWYWYEKNTYYIIKEDKKINFGNINSNYDFKEILTLEEFKQKYMETNEIHIEVPEGMEIDRENSTFECIKFKPKSLTYEDVAKELFEKKAYYIDSCGNVVYLADVMKYYTLNPNTATSKKQLEKLLAINKLMNVKKYLCYGRVANINEPVYSIYVDALDNSIKIRRVKYANYINVFFPDKETAVKAIDILGEDIIRLACSNDW